MSLERYIRFKRDFLYNFSISPQGYDYYSMTACETEEHFHWFLNSIPSRIEYLNYFCGNSVTLDFSYESLIGLWKFFLTTARVEKIPRERLKELRKAYAAFGNDFVGTRQLSVATEYFLKDIGIYLSEVFKKDSPQLFWHYSTNPKSYFFVNRPMLAGFLDYDCDPPFPCEMDPIHMAGVQAAKLLDNRADMYDLYNMTHIWRKKIQNL